jgi:hypothetical protein
MPIYLLRLFYRLYEKYMSFLFLKLYLHLLYFTQGEITLHNFTLTFTHLKIYTSNIYITQHVYQKAYICTTLLYACVKLIYVLKFGIYLYQIEILKLMY